MARSLPYAAGDVVAVPLRDRGFALGVVARADGKGVALGYFFGPRLDSPRTLTGPVEPDPRDAIHVCLFGDRAILRRDWPIVGRVASWTSAHWPLPVFCRNGDTRVIYDESSLSVLAEERTGPGGCNGLPQDGVAGSGFVEMVLTRLLVPMN